MKVCTDKEFALAGHVMKTKSSLLYVIYIQGLRERNKTDKTSEIDDLQDKLFSIKFDHLFDTFRYA